MYCKGVASSASRIRGRPCGNAEAANRRSNQRHRRTSVRLGVAVQGGAVWGSACEF